jgi:predicted MFS family arabinose efflux permease
MLKQIGRNNQRYMVSNFLFALGTGLWLNLRPLFLADLGAQPEQIGLALAFGGISAGIIPIPAGILSDRFGPRRVIIFAWVIALIGAVIMALASTWQIAAVGIFIWSLTWAANPAITSFVVLSMPPEMRGANMEKAFSWIFRVWPFAMLFSPALGGWIADRFSIQTDIWLSAVIFLLAIIVFWSANEVKTEQRPEKFQVRKLFKNKEYWVFVGFFGFLALSQQIGFTLLPNFLKDVGNFSQGTIGTLYSVSFLGTFLGNVLIARVRPRTAFLIFIAASWIGMVLLLLFKSPLAAWLAFLLFGSLTAMWLLKAAGNGRIVSAEIQGIAFGLVESITFIAMSVSSAVAGMLYGLTPGHTLPLLVSVVSIPAAFLGWLFVMRPITGEPPK